MSDAFGWAICRPLDWKGNGGEPLLFTVENTRAEAIEKALAMWGQNWSWKQLYRQGWRARHVQVTPMLFDENPNSTKRIDGSVVRKVMA